MLVGKRPAGAIESRPHVEQEGDRGRFLRWVEGLAELAVFVAILPGSGPQKLQFTAQALLATVGSDTVHHRGEYSRFVGRLVVRVGVEVETHRFAVNLNAQ
jgi:hypothetical protein